MNPSPHPIPAVSSRNRFEEDPAFRTLLERHLSPTALAAAEPWFQEMGERSAGPIDELAFQADAHPPALERYDRQGDRVDRIVFHPAYRELERLSFGSGILGRFYEAQTRACLGPHCSQVKFGLGYLFTQAEQGVYCPVAMSDGAAHLLERHAAKALRERYLPRLTTTSLAELHQGAMFLTEREGGSDVGATTTVARCEGGCYRLTGEKWFCSNAGAEVMMVLARVQQADGSTVAGTRGLGLFLVPRALEDGSLNALRVRQLKNKLGTRSMATGEVSLRGALGYPVGPPARGFLAMTEMLNLCRLYNSVAALGLTRRVLWEAATYLAERRAFGRAVDSYGLVQDLLCDLFSELEGSLEILFSVARDREESGQTSAEALAGSSRGKRRQPGCCGRPAPCAGAGADEEARGCLRLMTPLLKLNTARLAVRAASEAIELLGGIGYLEDGVTARFYRDAQVLPVWEGTTNIMYLDAVRWVVKEQAHRAVCGRIERLVAPVSTGAHAALAEKAGYLASELCASFDRLPSLSQEVAPLAGQRLCDALYRLYMMARLLPAADQSPRLAAVARRLAHRVEWAATAAPLAPDDLPGAYQAIVREAVVSR